jgi:hypothetical protein
MVTVEKDELLNRIQSIENDELFAVLNADISFFLGEKDVLDSISEEDQLELQQMVSEPFGFETESEEQFKKATERWRTK